MIYRRKIILSILEQVNKPVEEFQLQNLVYLFCQDQAQPVYEFITDKNGRYSFTLQADLNGLVKEGSIQKTNQFFSIPAKSNYHIQLKPGDCFLLETKLMQYANPVTAAIIKNAKAFTEIENTKLNSGEPVLFTIGYEGISVEKYFNRLLSNNIHCLVDVRNNPRSRKPGFSKTSLQDFCNQLGIAYFHYPELGIRKEFRYNLKDQYDYDTLLNHYRNDQLQNTKDTQSNIIDLLKKHKRVSLTCFEADVNQCHRKYLAESIVNLSMFPLSIIHI